MVGPILEALERKIGLRRDATRAPLRAPEWQRATSMPRPPRNTQISTRPRLTYCGPKLVLTKGSTLNIGQHAPVEFGWKMSAVLKINHNSSIIFRVLRSSEFGNYAIFPANCDVGALTNFQRLFGIGGNSSGSFNEFIGLADRFRHLIRLRDGLVGLLFRGIRLLTGCNREIMCVDSTCVHFIPLQAHE